MKNFIIIVLFVILSCLNESVYASTTSTSMFYTPSLATENLNKTISELTNDAMLYNFNFADELNLIQRDSTENKTTDLKNKVIESDSYKSNKKYKKGNKTKTLQEERNRSNFNSNFFQNEY